MRPILEQLDHAYLNDIPGLENPTIEVMSRWLWDRLAPQVPGLYELVLHETPRARCVYRGRLRSLSSRKAIRRSPTRMTA